MSLLAYLPMRLVLLGVSAKFLTKPLCHAEKIVLTLRLDKMFKYVYRVAIALSILLNVLAGGHPNQTFSARNYEWRKQGRPNIVWLIDWLTKDPNHCLVDWVNWQLIRDTLNAHGARP